MAKSPKDRLSPDNSSKPAAPSKDKQKPPTPTGENESELHQTRGKPRGRPRKNPA